MKDVKQVVQTTYTAVLEQGKDCGCSTDCCFEPDLEGYKDLAGYAESADYQLGCGIPVAFDAIQPGMVVLDLGSGAGNDVFIARQQAGPTGEVIGLDFTPAMVEKAEANRQKLGYDNVRFVLGEIESIPLPARSIDVVISNCVLNLVPDKQRAFAEIRRVLKSNGQFVISDVVSAQALPEAVQQDEALYGGCIGGAIPIQDYLALIQASGFDSVEVLEQRAFQITAGGESHTMHSITVKGGNAPCCGPGCC
ncbi:MAG: arsenite methyltransferase [Phaeodactylibacter sp.]|nr:arsenite methyltransferase [Phaeodactylibacter sp.]